MKGDDNMDEKFKGYYYSGYEVFDFKKMTGDDIKYGNHLLLQIGRGGIDVYKIMKLSDVYRVYGYFWIRDRIGGNDYVIVRERNKG